jgi:hypothetical protein
MGSTEMSSARYGRLILWRAKPAIDEVEDFAADLGVELTGEEVAGGDEAGKILAPG